MQEKLALAVGVIVPVSFQDCNCSCLLVVVTGVSLDICSTHSPLYALSYVYHHTLAWCDSRVQVCQSKTELCNEERGKKEQRRATKGGSLSLDAMSPWWPETA